MQLPHTLCPQKSEPPKHFATATTNLHRFKWNFTHIRQHLFLSPTSNLIRIPFPFTRCSILSFGADLLLQNVKGLTFFGTHGICILPHFLHISVTCTYRIFFPHKMAFSTAISISFVFLLPISIWLPTKWHHPCVWTIPVERDGVVGFKQSCTMFLLHIWCLCGPHIFVMRN